MNRVKFFLTLFLITFVNIYSLASPINLPESDVKLIKSVVRSQLDAFAIDDLVTILRKGIELATDDIKKEGLWSSSSN